MAFTKAALKLLVDDFRNRGIQPHGKLLTLSRYSLHFDEDYFIRICQNANLEIKLIKNENSEIMNDEIVFKALGFEHSETMDYSEYEYADIIFDLNSPDLPTELENKYDFILDGGTIEHVFNTPVVLQNIFKMLKPGGTFIFDQPMFYGINHGYYNFSPAMYYEYFKANNYVINSFIPYFIKEDFVYIADPVINNIFGNIPMIDNSLNQIWGSVTKTTSTTCDAIPYQGLFTAIWEASPNGIIGETLKSADDNSVFLYGTGGFVREMIKMLPNKYRVKIAGLISNDDEFICTNMYGYKVYTIDDIIDNCTCILIATSEQYQNIVYDRIKHFGNNRLRIIRLFT